MRKLLFISLLFGIILNSYGQIINLSPDSTLYDLHLLPPIGTPIIVPVSPSFFAGGIVWVEGTDTTQYDSIYVNADSSILNFESDGLLFQIPPVVFTPEYQAVLDEMVTPPIGDTLTWQNDMVYSLDTAGIWDTRDGLWILHAPNEQAALLNWIAPTTTAVAINAPTFNRYESYQFDGATDYLNLQYDPGNDGTNVGQNDISMGYYCLTNNSTAVQDMGVNDGTADLLASRNATVLIGYVNSVAPVSVAGTSIGFISVDRDEGTNQEIYKNGVEVDTEVDNSTGLPTGQDMTLGAYNNNGPIIAYSDRAYLMGHVGGSLTSTQHAAFYTIMQTYLAHF